MEKLFQSAWQPLTPRGVAAFARASLGRLLLVEFIVAMLAALAVVWFLHEAWFPTVREAIRQLPAQGQIRRGELTWRGDSPTRLATGHFLAAAVDLWHEDEVGREAHVSVELGRTDFRISSLFGYVGWKYPKGWTIALNRTELEPWWGAWQPAILAVVAVVVVPGLMLGWGILATLYGGLAWLIGFFANRELNLRGSWRLASAALMPGALFLILAIICYGLSLIDLVRLAVSGGVHVLIGLVYLFISPLCLPRHPAINTASRNPFTSS